LNRIGHHLELGARVATDQQQVDECCRLRGPERFFRTASETFMTFARCRSLLVPGAAFAALVQAAAPTSASTPQAWRELDARSAAECSRLAGLADPRVGTPVRFGDELGIDVRVVTGIPPNARHDAKPVAMLCAFHRGSGRVEVVEAPEAVAAYRPGLPVELDAAAGTINYELVTRIGARVDRAHEGGEAPDAQEARA
jgi:hypothetical protein